ncbi:MAG: hypothetical protein GY795_26740 [Desulfobacterales bacterium]|nr:hypothetical protein [Desulfobacterales bacterium]
MMTVENDLIKLSERTKKRITRISDKLHGAFPHIQTIIICRAAGVEKAVEFDDFELFIFFDTKKRGESDSFLPGMGYEKREREFPSDLDLLSHFYKNVTPELEREYQDFVNRNMHYFEFTGTPEDFPGIISVIPSQMKEDNQSFCKFYLTKIYDRGYLIYRDDLKPAPAVP